MHTRSSEAWYGRYKQMARMHSRDKGQSGSHKPAELKKPEWVKYSEKEIELLIVKFAKEGKKPSQIGMYLRDEYGIPDVKTCTGKSITEILKSKDLTPRFPEDLQALFRKLVDIKEHLAKNHKDQPAVRGLTLTESKILRLVKYYKASGRLPKDWNYNPKDVKMYIN